MIDVYGGTGFSIADEHYHKFKDEYTKSEFIKVMNHFVSKVKTFFPMLFDFLSDLLVYAKQMYEFFDFLPFCMNNNVLEVQYFKKTKTKIKFSTLEMIKKHKLTGSMTIDTYKKKNKKKINTSLLVTIFHSRDSAIALDVVTILREEYGIVCVSIHDCFFIQPENYALLLKVYKRSLIQHT